MTVLDTSALISILLDEPDAPTFASAMEAQSALAISAGTLTEAAIVALRRGGSDLLRELYNLLEMAGVETVPLDQQRALEAAGAYQRFGRGVGSPPCLTFGDCFSYALANERNAPLLYKGDDFARTDIRSALSD